MPVLSFHDTTVVRGGRRILDRVRWEVSDGERWVVLGPNGAGKTTLLQLAGARLHPTEGTVEVLDERLGAVDVFELRPRIGLASAALAEQIPAGERVLDVVLTAAYARLSRWDEQYAGMDRSRATTLLAQLGASDLVDRTFGTLSEGERKRVQIARALMTDPELLLLDEPAAGLDLGGREELVARLSSLASDPRSPALVLVTHHVEEVPPAFTHLLLLRQGRVVGAGPLQELMDSAWLTATFGLPLIVDRSAGRYVARGLLPPGYG